jgi:serine protease
LPTNPNTARVINMSLGSAGTCSAAYQDAVNQLTAASVVVVVSAGNDGLTVGTPANCSGVIAVAGVRHSGTKVGYSDLGTAVTISAPAGNCVNLTGTCLYPILTTSNTGTSTPVAGAAGAKYTGGGSDASLGTSFSAPLVSGTVALMLSANASLTPAQVISALKSTARAFPSTGAATGVSACTAPTSVAQSSECYCTTTTCGAGMLDAGLAVAAAATPTSSSGGGGAMQLGWLLGWLASVIGVWAVTPRRQRR